MYIPNSDIANSTVEIGHLSLCRDSHSLKIGEQSIRLRNKLFLLLDYLATHRNQLIKRQELIDNIWDGNYYIGEKGLTHAICILRNMIKQEGDCSVIIETIPKTGYRLKVKNLNITKETPFPELKVKFDSEKPVWWPEGAYLQLSNVPKIQ